MPGSTPPRRSIPKPATVRFEVVDPLGADAVACVTAYFAELDERFPEGFADGDAIAADAAGFTAPSGAFIVGYAGTVPVACGGVRRLDDRTAEIKRMWVSRSWRGRGLGSAILSTLESLVGEWGLDRVMLDTNPELTEAMAMYEKAGYSQTDPYNQNPHALAWFEKTLT